MFDIIAISNRFDHSDIFLTMTCNQKRKEVTDSLLPRRMAQNRPDICARVFLLKLKALLHMLNNKELLGDTRAWIKVIAFQREDFPTPTASFLERQFKHMINIPHNVDRIMSTEIPGDDDPGSQEVFLKFNVHTPCRDIYSDTVCMN